MEIHSSYRYHTVRGDISHPDQKRFLLGCNHVYFCCKVGYFNMGSYRDRLAFGTSPKWPFKELHA